MKKTIIIVTLVVFLVSCKNEKKLENKIEPKIEISNAKTAKTNSISSEINWNDVSDLENIGKFPFVAIPTGLKINNEKDGLTNFFEAAKLENFTNKGLFSTNGKLGVLHFQDQKGFVYNQNLFENTFYTYFEKIGATELYKNTLPEINSENETQLNKLAENAKIGDIEFNYYNHGNYPTAVYVFKNNKKKYIANIQSNASEGNVFIMEIKEK